MKLVIATTGASGAIFAYRLLHHLGGLHNCENAHDLSGTKIDLVASDNAHLVWQTELKRNLKDSLHPRVKVWERTNFNAPFASGSSAPDAVIVAPCSMSTLARVAHGGGSDLIARACEVALKERKKLLLLVRETPLSRIHLQNLLLAHDAGATIMPAIPSYYAGITDLDQAIDTVIARALDHIGLDHHILKRWGESP